MLGTMTTRRVGTVVVSGLLVLVACGSGDAGSGSTGTSTTPQAVTISGMVTHKFGGCAYNAEAKLDGLQVSVFDQDGTLIATAKTEVGSGTCTKEPGGSEVEAPYTVEVPERPFYKLLVDDVPTDSTLEAAASCSAATIRSDMEAPAHYTIDLYTGMTRPDLLTGDPGPSC
jgi:hypothetical protein